MGARVRPAVLVVALLGCAPRPGAAPPSATPSTRTAGIANVTACVVADTSAPTRDTLYVVGVEAGRGDSGQPECERAATATSPVVITEKPGPDTDLRDVLDRGFPATHAIRPDVVVTRDPNVISYAAASAAYFTAVLPYDRTYTLAAADSTASVPSQAERDALARNAVTADVRGAAQPFAWLADASCVMPPAPAAVSSRPVLAYPAGDAIARQLAERVVALAAARARPAWLPTSLASSGTAPRVAAIDADSISDALATGRAAAAVLALPRDPRAHCGTANAPLAWRGVPLVDSRAHAIVRRGSGAAFIIRADGTLRFIRRALR